jgi:hypothetical protein
VSAAFTAVMISLMATSPSPLRSKAGQLLAWVVAEGDVHAANELAG